MRFSYLWCSICTDVACWSCSLCVSTFFKSLDKLLYLAEVNGHICKPWGNKQYCTIIWSFADSLTQTNVFNMSSASGWFGCRWSLCHSREQPSAGQAGKELTVSTKRPCSIETQSPFAAYSKRWKHIKQRKVMSFLKLGSIWFYSLTFFFWHRKAVSFLRSVFGSFTSFTFCEHFWAVLGRSWKGGGQGGRRGVNNSEFGHCRHCLVSCGFWDAWWENWDSENTDALDAVWGGKARASSTRSILHNVIRFSTTFNCCAIGFLDSCKAADSLKNVKEMIANLIASLREATQARENKYNYWSKGSCILAGKCKDIYSMNMSTFYIYSAAHYE